MAKRNFVIYCDESNKTGRFFSNFFGGVLLNAQDQQAIEELLQEKKNELALGNELKWQRVTKPYLEKYDEFIEYYFTFIASGRLRVRIMFTQNIHVPAGLTREQVEESYFRLYYQFIKHAFGIRYCNPNALDQVSFHLLLDQIPDSNEKTERFKSYISRIPNTIGLSGLNLHIPINQIADVDSKRHAILQGLDIILGAMCFRLNDKHKVKPEGQRKRGNRTIAKEKLYNSINRQIREIYPNFNIGITTGMPNGKTDRWQHSYRHWKFVPTQHNIDLERGKRRAPPKPT